MTEIEHWLRDPYTIYAKHILRLTPLDPIGAEPGAAERGTFIHAAIGEFTQRFADKLPDDPARALIELGRPHFAALNDYPEARAFWWPRFERIARWFARWEIARRPGLAAVVAEIRAELDIPLGDGTFKLRGIADRIERDADGRYIILDYKTGAARTEKQVRTGLAPQLTLEAAMLRQGQVQGHSAAGASVAELGYVLLKGGEPPGEPKMLKFKEGTPDSHADRALEKLHGARQALRRCRPVPIARWCIRCGRPITATTTISPASRNGRAPAARPKSPEAANETARRHSRFGAASCSAPSPTRPCRRGSPPMPARARPTCWCSA